MPDHPNGRLRRAALAAVVLAVPAAAAATPPPVEARYALADRFLAARDLVADLDVQARFVGPDDAVVLRHGRPGSLQILLVDPKTHGMKPLLDDTSLARGISASLGHPVAAEALHLQLLDYDPGNGAIALAAAGHRWRAGPGGRLDMQPGVPPARWDDPLLAGPEQPVSPDGHYRISNDHGDLIATDTRDGRSVRLTTDGSWEQPYGRAPAPLQAILAQGTEQPVLPVLADWSPDSRRILTFRLDTRGVQRWSITQQNAPDSRFPRSFRYVYPSAGAAVLPRVDRMLFDIPASFKAGHGVRTAIDVPTEQMLYPAAPDGMWLGDRPRIMWTARGYGALVAYDVDPATGKAQVVARERVRPLVTVTSTQLQPAPELGGELAVSERSGWAQLYLVRPADPDGGQALTRGEWEVTNIEHVDAATRTVLVTGVGREHDRNPYYRALYRVGLDGAPPVLLTPEALDHQVSLSEDGRWFIDSMSSPTVPTRTLLRDARDGRIVMELGHADPRALLATGFAPPEPFQAPASDGHTMLYGMIYRPAHAEPGRRYPVIDHVYTGPTTTDVPVTYEGTIGAPDSSLAQIGVVVVNIDGRGTSLRGQAFRLPAYQNLGNVGLDDHIGMIRSMAARHPELDAGRVGVWGHSAGGFDAARFILRRPEFFKVAVAGSGVHDLRLDKAWWPEVTMGAASDAVWDANSNIAVAGNLRGKLLLMHGDVDDNVPVTESFHLQKALIDAGRDVDFVIVPNKRHGIYGPYAWRQLRDYFTLNLLRELPPLDPVIGKE